MSGFITELCLEIVIWVYLLEITCDVAFGMSLTTFYVLVMIQASTFDRTIEALKPQGFFYLYAILSLIAFLYTFYWAVETKDLLEEQKK